MATLLLSEKEIAAATLEHFQRGGWDCYPEVRLFYGGQRADIVAVRGGLVLVCETKRTCTMALFDQIIGWTAHANFLYIAHPKRGTSRRRGGSERVEAHLLRYFGIGRLTLSVRKTWNGSALQLIETDRAAYRRAPLAPDLLARLNPEMKRYAAGSKNEGFYTPWRQTMDAAVRFVQQNSGCTMRQIVEGISHHYASDRGARASIAHWLPLEPGIFLDQDKFFYREENR